MPSDLHFKRASFSMLYHRGQKSSLLPALLRLQQHPHHPFRSASTTILNHKFYKKPIMPMCSHLHSNSVLHIHMLPQALQAAQASPKSKHKATVEPTKRNNKKPAKPAPQPEVPPALDIITRPNTRHQASPHPLCLLCAPECIQGSHIYRRQNLMSSYPSLHHLITSQPS